MFYREHPRVTFHSGDQVITKQSHKQECDINNILKQYQRTGIINHINRNQPQYMELPDQLDYQQSINTILQAQDAFASLPAVVRNHFNNDPAAFLAAFTDPAQSDYLRDHGFLNPKPDQAPPPSPLPEQSS